MKKLSDMRRGNLNSGGIRRCSRLFTGLLIVLLTFAVFSLTGCSEERAGSLNASGNVNRSLAVDPIRNSEEFSAVLYNNRNGLPTSDTNAVAQTEEGFLWIGSYAGLIRYDGNTFERLYSTEGIANVRCLYVDHLDRLWVGTNDSGLFVLSQGKLTHWDKSDGLRSNSIRAIAEDPQGCIYIACAAGGLVTIRETPEPVPISDGRIDGQTITELRRGTDDLIYGLTQNGDLFTLRDGGIASYLSRDDYATDDAQCILPDPDHPGRVYLGTSNARIYYGELSDHFRLLSTKSIEPLTYVYGMEAIDGQIWVGADNGIGRLGEDGFRQLENVPMNNSVEHILTDYEGNLWFASSHQGIMKVVHNPFTDLFKHYQLPESVVNSTCRYGDQLFIGTDAGLIVMEGGERLSQLPLSSIRTASGKRIHATDLLRLLNGVRVRCMLRDSRDRLWIPLWHKYGLIRYDHGDAVVFTEEDGLFSDAVRTVYERADGTIVAAGNGGASAIRDDRITERYGEEDGIVNGTLLTVEEGFQGELLLGSDGDGIYILGPDGTRHLGTEEGLRSEIVLRIKKSTKRDVIWIITGNSLAYMTPDYQVTTIREFPYPNCYDLYENSAGDVWILSSAGIYVAPADELLANGPIEPTFYGIQSGLPCAASANATSELTPEGDLYIAGIAGVTRVNIEKAMNNIVSLKVAVPYVDADEERIYPDENGRFTVPGNTRKLTIYPYVFNYSLIEPLITYELEGFDWPAETLEADRLSPIDYTNLRIGNYTFIMTVKDTVGRTEQTMSFPIAKGMELTVGKVCSMVLDSAALALLVGIVILTAVYRRRRRVTDRLFFYMTLINMVMAAGELLSYRLENITLSFVHPVMILCNTAYYAALVIFPYLLAVYLLCRNFRDHARLQKGVILLGIPAALCLVIVLLNLWTGWLFSIGEGNIFVSGSERLLWAYSVVVWLYLTSSLVLAFRIGPRMGLSIALLIVVRLIGDLVAWKISATALDYAMLLVVVHLCAMRRLMNEVAT